MDTMEMDDNFHMNTEIKGFYKRTRRGQVIRLVREKYVHNDIDIGYGYINNKQISLDELYQLTLKNIHKHYIIIDTNIILHQIDLLEHFCNEFIHFIIIQTVIQEVKHQKLSIYQRLIELMKDTSRFFIFYPNEISQQTIINRNINETINDSNDRAIRNTTLYYHNILSNIQCKAILITNDLQNQVIKNFTYFIHLFYISIHLCYYY